MTNVLLTLMLLTLPMLTLRNPAFETGLNTGLWVSMFFFGRLHASWSVLVFSIALFHYIFTSKPSASGMAHIQVKRSITPQLIIFLSCMMIFCALGNITPAYAAFLRLDQSLLETASFFGFLGSIVGPVFFGRFSDKKGPFPSMMAQLLLAAAAIAAIAYSAMSPRLFPLGEFMLWMSISGTFVVIPIFTLLYFGQKHMTQIAPPWILFLTALWAIVYFTFETDTAQIQHASTCLTFSIFLILAAAFFSTLAWKKRFVLIQ